MARADMNGIVLGRNGSASDEAAAWFVRLRDNAISDRERGDFTTWLEQSPTHAAAMAEMADIWAGLDILPELRTAPTMPPPKAAFPVTRRQVLAGVGLSATAAGIGWAMLPQRGLKAPVGGHLQVNFATDATLDLDSDSIVAIDASAPAPIARLRRGQIFIDTARPAGKSITLQVPFGHIRAETAVFNLKLERYRALVSVQSGRVEVDHPSDGVLAIGPLTELAFNDRTMQAPRELAPYRIAPWRQGRLIFDQTLLVDALDDLNRYRSGRIITGDPRLDDLLVTGTFATDRSDEALAAILATFSLKSLNFGDALTVLFAT